MKKSATLLLLICFTAMIGLLALQGYWIVKYYKVTQSNFEKEVNLAFEDAIKKEFELRCDTIEKLIINKLLDTSAFSISSKLDQNQKLHIINIRSKAQRKEALNVSFTASDLNRPNLKGDTSFKRKIAVHMARLMRTEDLENHVIYYRTQELGEFLNEKALKFQFDTTSLRPIFTRYLKERNIKIPFKFWYLKQDSTTNKNHFKASLLKKFPVITKAHPTYKRSKDSFVRAMFKDPFQYILSNLWLILISSVLLITLTASCMTFILKSLFKEKRLSAIKNDFISNITHEFKTPIATVSVAVEALKTPEVRADQEKTNRYLNHASSEIHRLNLLVDQVLNLALYDHKQAELKKESIEINNTLNDLIRIHQVSEEKQIDAVFKNESGETHVFADRTQFQHAIHNVLDNAIKYSSNQVKIDVQVSKTERQLIFRIRDEGVGIPESQIDLVFEKFYRVRSPDNHFIKGYGLGLNYVKQIMEQHEGWCSIESKSEKGTTITLAWPI